MGDVIQGAFGKKPRMSDEELRAFVAKFVGETLLVTGISPHECQQAAKRVTDSAMDSIQALRLAFTFTLELQLGDLGISEEVAAEIDARISMALRHPRESVADALAVNVFKPALDALVIGALAMRASS